MALPRGIRNNNPLNIVKGNSWKGERAHQTDKRFEEFESIEMGLRAGFIILRNYIEGTKTRPTKFNTIRKIVSRWAPPSENCTQRYIDNVCKWSGLLPDEVVLFRERKKMVAIVQAMAKMECGVTLDIALIESAYDLV